MYSNSRSGNAKKTPFNYYVSVTELARSAAAANIPKVRRSSVDTTETPHCHTHDSRRSQQAPLGSMKAHHCSFSRFEETTRDAMSHEETTEDAVSHVEFQRRIRLL